MLCGGIDRMLFFSPKSLEESVQMGFPIGKCKLIHWGEDIDYVKPYLEKISDGGFWLSSGKEKRDFYTLDKAAERVNEFSNMEVMRDGHSYLETLEKTLKCRGIVVIPNSQGLKYCTGLTCIMEAFALGKPIISVRNPYYPFDLEKVGAGLYVNIESPNEIADAIQTIESDNKLYESMCRKSKEMANSYNMRLFAKELYEIIENMREI